MGKTLEYRANISQIMRKKAKQFQKWSHIIKNNIPKALRVNARTNDYRMIIYLQKAGYPLFQLPY